MGNSLSDEHSKLEPPDPISNSEVKRLSADGSVGFPHVRVGHRQASKKGNPEYASARGFFIIYLRDRKSGIKLLLVAGYRSINVV